MRTRITRPRRQESTVRRWLPWGTLVGILGFLMCAGCAGSGEGTQRGEEPAAASLKPAPVSFEMSTDTVDVLRRGERSSGVLEPGARDTVYSVQIGAFRNPGNASSAEIRAQERFPHPVLRYHDPAGLFHIRVGRFSTRRAAESLKSEMQTTYPRDYHDCWVVQITEPE